jgi:phenylacetate-CoA ligase
MLLLTTGPARSRSWPLPWRYVPFDAPVDEVVEAIERFRPHLLYGWVSSLFRLAEHVGGRGGLRHRPAAVVTTAEPLDRQARLRLSEALGGEVFEIYGLTEMGAVAWECRGHHGLHVSEDTSIVESVDGRLVLTNLRLLGMPFIRYDCGDLAGWMEAPPPCPCGCAYRRLSQVAGRLVDRVPLPDGREVSPYQLTLALEKVGGLARYQVVQTAADRLEVGFVLRRTDPSAAAQVREAVSILAGPGVTVVAVERTNLDPPPGTKFRVVERRVPPAGGTS